MRLAHKHFTPVAPAPLPPDPPDLFGETETRPGCMGCGVTHTHFTPKAFAEITALFQEVWPPAQNVDTSLEAARRIRGRAARDREAIWLWLRTQGSYGATRGEITAATGIPGDTARPRIRELEGDAPWAKGKLPRRITRTAARRAGMRIYTVVAPRDSGNPDV